MLSVRHFRTSELPLILRRGVETSLTQLVPREIPGATPAGVTAQLHRMYELTLRQPQATVLVVDWPAGPAVSGFASGAGPTTSGFSPEAGSAAPGFPPEARPLAPGFAHEAGPAAYTLLLPQPNAFTGEPELMVMDIYTHPQVRGRGIGKELLAAAARYAHTVGCRSMAAQVALHNEASLRLFRSCGFQEERVLLGRRL